MLVVSYIALGALLLVLVAALTDAVRRLDKCVEMQETLFQELQHRVANNMQVVASTLSTAGRGLKDRAAIEVVEYAAARVRSMSKLYRQLYQPSAYDSGLEAVLRDVLGEVFRGLPVTVEVDVQAGRLSVRTMTALVLLVNEAAINACKHVFCPRRGTVFSVSLRECPDGEMELRLCDDGPGLKAIATSTGNGERLGMAIMRSFARQLGGTLAMLDGPGVGLSVAFKAC
jgi:two-component sensor histidine kinase